MVESMGRTIKRSAESIGQSIEGSVGRLVEIAKLERTRAAKDASA